MKKIGIITFSRAQNHGATLQCMALQKTIANIVNDSDVKVIDYRNKYVEHSYKVFSIDTSNIKTCIRTIISSLVFFKKNFIRNKKYKKFILTHLNFTKECTTKKQVEEITKDFDYIIVGSDQVWNPFFAKSIDDVYFLNFKTPAKKISYAASLGFNKMEDKKLYKKLLGNIDNISIREKDGCKIVSNILNKDIKNTLDPTLLLTREEWENYFNKNNTLTDKYIFAYVPGNLEGYEELVNTVSDKLNKKVVNIRKRDTGIRNILKNAFTSTPDEFLNYIYNADIVVTTSFHAVVFALIFEKKFWVLAPKNNSSRINNLLEKLNLSYRSVDNIEKLKQVDLMKDINYKDVKIKLEELRQDSLNWLTKMLTESDKNE